MAYELPPDYKQVPERIADLKEKFPDARLQPADPAIPYTVARIGDQTFIVYVAACYRDENDTRPGIGCAWEPYPGKTPYTRDSELMNAETSAWGRAIVAALASESKSVASAEEVRNRQADHVEQNQSGSGPIVQSRRVQHSTVRPAPETGEKASPKQVQLLKKLSAEKGVPVDAPEKLTKGAASKVIESLMAMQAHVAQSDPVAEAFPGSTYEDEEPF